MIDEYGNEQIVGSKKFEEYLHHRMDKEFCNDISCGDMNKELALQYANEFFGYALELLAEVKRYQLKDCAITQAEHMGAKVGDNTWHYAMEVWLYPETHYWTSSDVTIERYISTNRDAWVKHWGEPSDMKLRRDE